jgi:hypothetical protein
MIQIMFRAATAVCCAAFVAGIASAQTPPDSVKSPVQRPATQAPPPAPPRAPFWPDSVRGPVARAGAILPFKRVVAFYGNPLSTRMGILGQIPPAQMFVKLEQQARAWAEADSTVPVQPALELIATVAQASPGRDDMYRLRMPDSLIEQVYQWAHEHNWLLVLDIQVGRSDVATEIEPLRKFLVRPEVHLGIDPEFDVKPHQRPGMVIGTTDAKDINVAVDALANIVETSQLPPKLLIVHRFTKPMLTNASAIQLDPRVQVVMHMDGFGTPAQKRSTLEAYIKKEPVQWVGFKLFFKNDHPMLTPAEVLKLRPIALFISYQ